MLDEKSMTIPGSESGLPGQSTIGRMRSKTPGWVNSGMAPNPLKGQTAQQPSGTSPSFDEVNRSRNQTLIPGAQPGF